MAARKTLPEKTPDFETALAQLEALVARLEGGQMSLEESLKAFEDGVRLTRLCQETLASAQQKVQILMQQDGQAVLQPFSVGDDDTDADDGDDA